MAGKNGGYRSALGLKVVGFWGRKRRAPVSNNCSKCAQSCGAAADIEDYAGLGMAGGLGLAGRFVGGCFGGELGWCLLPWPYDALGVRQCHVMICA